MTCQVCGVALPASVRRDAKYCSKACNLVGQPPCSADGCDRPRRAKRLCNPHYKKQCGGYRTHARTCIVCGLSWNAARADSKYCSDLCKGLAYAGVNVRLCDIPASHPVRSTPVPDSHPSRAPRPRRVLECAWCGTRFEEKTSRSRFCTPRCKGKATRTKRKGREADGRTFSWAHVMRVFLLLGGRCAYCDRLVVGPPDPDHVVPLSRGGSNGIGNILPSCRPCNSDKRDLLLSEWAEDRARRGKPPVRTQLDRTLAPFAHLIPDAITSGRPRCSYAA